MHFGLKWVKTVFMSFQRAPGPLKGGIFRNSQLALTHFLKIQIVLINPPFKQSKSLLY